MLAYAGFRIARRSADRFVQLASVAITVWLIGQAAMNMGYVVGLLPVTGVQLPLISAGGTSLVLTLFIVGLLARFARAEPAAIEAQRARERGRLAAVCCCPCPVGAVDPVRPSPSTGERRRGPTRSPAASAASRAPAGSAAPADRGREPPVRPDRRRGVRRPGGAR